MIVNMGGGEHTGGDEIYLPPAPHFSAEPKPARVGHEVMVTTAAPVILERSSELAGVRPGRLSAGDSLEVTAYEPAGAVEHLLWLRNWRPEWQRTYYFRHPVQLPKGTRIAAYSGKPAEAAIIAR